MTFEPKQRELVETTLTDPVLIAAFTSRDKAGAAGTSTLAYLIGHWKAEQVGEIECDDLFNYARIRPQMRRDEDKMVIDWPTTQVYKATPPGSQRSFLLMIGLEPHLGWKTFVERLAGYAKSMDVKTFVSLRGLPAAATHRMPVSVEAAMSDDDLEERYGLSASGLNAEGPADIGVLLSLRLQQEGCETIDLYAMEPYYVPPTPHAGTTLALADAIDRAFGLKTEKSALRRAVALESRALDEAVEQSAELQAVVAQLQESIAPRGLLMAPGGSTSANPSGEPLDAGDVLSDVEELLGLSHSDPDEGADAE